MSIVLFNESDIRKAFAMSELIRGKSYFQAGQVTQLHIDEQGISALVQGSDKVNYQVYIDLNNWTTGVALEGLCTCEATSNCRHAAAALWAVLLQAINKPQSTPAVAVDVQTERILYLLTINGDTSTLYVEPCIARSLKKGSYSKPRPLTEYPAVDIIPGVTADDKQVLHCLSFLQQHYPQSMHEQCYPLKGANGIQLLQNLLKTQRCHWVSLQHHALSLGAAREARLEWVPEGRGLQRLCCRVDAGVVSVLPVTPPWYVDHQTHQCGPLETGLEPAVASALLAAPPMKPEQIQQLYTALSKRKMPSLQEPAITHKITLQRVLKIKPIPCLRLSQVDIALKPCEALNWQKFYIQLPVVILSFHYQQLQIEYADTREQLDYIEGEVLTQICRDKDAEQAAYQFLQVKGLQALSALATKYELTPGQTHYFQIADANERQRLLNFSLYELPQFRVAGWEVNIDIDYPYQVVVEGTTEWYSDIQERSDHHWFDLELGIYIEGQKINLLPLLTQLVQDYLPEFNQQAVAQLADDAQLLVRLPDGRYFPVPVMKIRHILKILTELYDTDSLNGADKLPLAELRIIQLIELEAAMGSAKLRWLGSERIRKLGMRLQNFKGMTPIQVPASFKTQLRPYQQDGLNWMQFLREYGLNGLLADDMGLGKTVQALAHLLVEKYAGRMDKPSLIIAPTSLIHNWRQEADRFAPDLKLLILHGSDRKPQFDLIKKYDVVLTTYPLLVRDKTSLLQHDYHFLILDEAQIIKNAKAKATLVAQQLTARHRLCLTGTPMENHLGELWSLFHFLLPGLLGDHKQYQRLFRNPIEKQNDQERRASLAQRVAPFMLRRSKKDVVKELPSKIEMIRTVELEGTQRDLYESIRIAMHDKIAQLLKQQGLANNHMVILDALLKLRQICCDPRLLKLPTTKQISTHSAKLELLMELLPKLIAEGRKVLLFSQFTTMLELIEHELAAYQIPYVKLTGQTKERHIPIERFQNGEVPLFLISLKAGGVGLNLTAADTVIHYDPWWNPAVEQQATDRAHRIGQDKTVFVYKLLTNGTVEEKILEMQAQKQALLDGLFSDKNANLAQLNLDDLAELFKPLS